MHLTCPQQRGKMYHLGLCSNLGCQGSPSFVKRTGTFTENSLGKHLTGHILCQHNFYYEAREDKREKRNEKGKTISAQEFLGNTGVTNREHVLL